MDRIRILVSDFDLVFDFCFKFHLNEDFFRFSYYLIGADGKKYRVRYTADEFGYHPVTEEDNEPDPVYVFYLGF